MTDETAPPRPPGPATLHRLCEELIVLREHNTRQHKLFERALAEAREGMMAGFQQFAADTTRAYQQLREEQAGERRVSIALGGELVDLTLDLDRLTAGRPDASDAEAVARWAEAVAVAARKAQAGLARLGIVRFDAVVGEPYNPALHERVGDKSGGEPGRIAEQVEPGFAGQVPGLVLRRPKVLVSV